MSEVATKTKTNGRGPILSALTRHDLPSGAWIDLKDPLAVSGEDYSEVIMTDAALLVGVMEADLVAAMMVAAWSFDEPVPTLTEAAKFKRFLCAADLVSVRGCAPVRAGRRLFFPDFSVDAMADPQSPTEPSAG